MHAYRDLTGSGASSVLLQGFASNRRYDGRAAKKNLLGREFALGAASHRLLRSGLLPSADRYQQSIDKIS